MSDIRLFRIDQGKATAIASSASHLEKPLQVMIESNLDSLLGIRFVASEYSTGKTHAGRIDTLGLDEDNCPVILEYKRSASENVINQGLFYLDWLMDHQAEFKLLVLEKFGMEVANLIDWSGPRLICIAADFTKYDGHAVQQINRNIELIRYRRFGNDLLLLEQANAVSSASASASATSAVATAAVATAASAANSSPESLPSAKPVKTATADRTVADWMSAMPSHLAELFGELETYLRSLGDDVQRKDLKLYVAFKRLRNFASVVFLNKGLRVCLNLNPDHYREEDGFNRDVRRVGHWGTGDLELTIRNLSDLNRAKPYLLAAYEGETA